MSRDLTPIHPDLRSTWKKFPKLPYNWLSVRVINFLMAFTPSTTSSTVDIGDLYAESRETQHKVKLRVYRPRTTTTPLPALIWIHGGGLLIGSTKQDDAFMIRIVEALEITVFSVDYRLAPGHPYPAAIDDCYTALAWVHRCASDLGINPDRIAVGGQSAGGGLAASLAQMAHDRGEVDVIFQLLVYPMLDDRSALASPPHSNLLTWTTGNNRLGWETYLQQPVGSSNVPAYAVPSRREDLTGLPPVWMGVGSLDLFYEEDKTYAEKLKRCGIDCELVVVEGAFHGFDVFDDPVAPVQDFRNAQIEALRRHLLAFEVSVTYDKRGEQ